MDRKLLVTALWDEEAKVWVATSDDIPGLVTEAATLDDLVRRITAVAPELLEDNAHLFAGDLHTGGMLDVHILSQLSVERSAAH